MNSPALVHWVRIKSKRSGGGGVNMEAGFTSEDCEVNIDVCVEEQKIIERGRTGSIGLFIGIIQGFV